MTMPLDRFANSSLRASLASAALPKRVRDVLEELYALAADELSRQLERMLVDFEQQLFRLADHARNQTVQAQHFETMRALRQNRADLVPRFLSGLEDALCRIREPTAPAAEEAATPLHFGDLRLLDDDESSEHTLLSAIARRHESRAGLPLQLLGQRFGVLAAAPAFDVETLPVGPQQLGLLMSQASEVLQIELDAKLMLLKTFDREVMSGHEQLIETLNTLLARRNVLPNLAFVPLRMRPTVQKRDDGESAVPREGGGFGGGGHGVGHGGGSGSGGHGGGGHGGGDSHAGGARSGSSPHTGWLGGANDQASVAEENEAFDLLQQLLSGRRGAGAAAADAGAPARMAMPTFDVVSTLGKLQGTAPAGRNLAELRHSVLLQARQQLGQPAALSREDSDTFELLGMLYAEIGRELRAGAENTALLERLQVPLLRVALQDRAFFVRSHHPARQLLNAVAESGARWLGEDDVDPHLNAQLQQAVEHVVEHYDGDAAVFESANHALQEKLQAMARKAEISERRHVEAARGKEKLAMAKRRASEVIEEAVSGQGLPKFSLTLLTQAWADALTLTMLRHGEDSTEWAQQVEATRQMVAAHVNATPAPAGLVSQVEEALTTVGYHANEASTIATRLTAGAAEDHDDAATRTQLAVKLKARARLGEDAEERMPKLPPRTSTEQSYYEQLRTLPFGTWFEFEKNQQGEMVRRRLSWYSPMTDHALFVNQRGHRVGEHSLDGLSRMMATGRARLVTADKGRLVDRAWQAALNALRSLAGRGDNSAEVGA
ncbi:DUF1631 family protein [Lysobacter koreensis]|uniref:DUF1631 family protein n=1 Tax=Lysobacter koreensis TaxID=266122 RepID=A0ABW2YLB2_9GAMM